METQIFHSTSELPHDEIKRAADLLLQGELVAFPTETVYGLGARIFHENQIRKIFSVKNRPLDNPLIAHISNLHSVTRIAQNVPFDFFTLAEKFFPGPLTIVVEKHPDVPAVVSAGLHSIAIRMPNHPIALQLIEQVGEPLVAPSANRSGKPSPTTAEHVLQDLHGEIAAVLDGGSCSVGIESTVLSLLNSTPTILRPGLISKVELEDCLGKEVLELPPSEEELVSEAHSPGMRYRHYAPNAKILLVESFDNLDDIFARTQYQSAVFLSATPFVHVPWRELSAQTLYAEFRRADSLQADVIVILVDDSIKAQTGLYNRILKASQS